MKYRKKPVVIEAIQWTGENVEEIKSFAGTSAVISYYFLPTKFSIKFEVSSTPVKGSYIGLTIHTLEGDMQASFGDYIIQGINGEFYPCKPDIFEKTYERV